MAIYTQKEFAEMVIMPPNRLTIYANRGKLHIVNKYIDTDVEKNQRFLEKYRSKNIGKTLKVPEKKPIKPTKEKKGGYVKKEKVLPPKPDIENRLKNIAPVQLSLELAHEGQNYYESERQLKYLDTLKRKKEIEKLDIDIAKKKGEVIPSLLISPLFLQHNQSILTEFKYAVDEVIRIFSKKNGLDVNEVANIRGTLTKSINDSVEKATFTTIKAVTNIVNEFSEKKGVGERNV